MTSPGEIEIQEIVRIDIFVNCRIVPKIASRQTSIRDIGSGTFVTKIHLHPLLSRRARQIQPDGLIFAAWPGGFAVTASGSLNDMPVSRHSPPVRVGSSFGAAHPRTDICGANACRGKAAKSMSQSRCLLMADGTETVFPTAGKVFLVPSSIRPAKIAVCLKEKVMIVEILNTGFPEPVYGLQL